MEKINFWSNKVKYTPKTSAQSYIQTSASTKQKKHTTNTGGYSSCSCGVYVDCSACGAY